MPPQLNIQFRKCQKHLNGKLSDVLLNIWSHSNARGRAWPSVELIAEEIDASTSTVTNAKKWLLNTRAITLVPFDKRVDDELYLPARQHIYQLTGYFFVNGELFLYLNISQEEQIAAKKLVAEHFNISESKILVSESKGEPSLSAGKNKFLPGTDNNFSPPLPVYQVGDSVRYRSTGEVGVVREVLVAEHIDQFTHYRIDWLESGEKFAAEGELEYPTDEHWCLLEDAPPGWSDSDYFVWIGPKNKGRGLERSPFYRTWRGMEGHEFIEHGIVLTELIDAWARGEWILPRYYTREELNEWHDEIAIQFGLDANAHGMIAMISGLLRNRSEKYPDCNVQPAATLEELRGIPRGPRLVGFAAWWRKEYEGAFIPRDAVKIQAYYLQYRAWLNKQKESAAEVWDAIKETVDLPENNGYHARVPLDEI